MYGRPKYSDLKLYEDNIYFQSTKRKILVKTSTVLVETTGITCPGTTQTPEGDLPTYNYKLMRGPDSDSIILLKTIKMLNTSHVCQPIELIQNVSKKYVNLIIPTKYEY